MKVDRFPNSIRIHCDAFGSLLNPLKIICVFDWQAQAIDFQWSNGKRITCPIDAVQDVWIFYRAYPDYDHEATTGLVLDLSDSRLSQVYLSRGSLTEKDAIALETELRSYLKLPAKPPYHGFSSKGWENTRSHILEKGIERLIYKHNYLRGTAIACSIILAFLMLVTLIPILTASPPIPQILVGILIGIMMLIAQYSGFSETWTFERSTRQVKITRKLLIGKRTKTFSSQEVIDVQLRTAIPSASGQGTQIAQVTYTVDLALSPLMNQQTTGSPGILYSSTDLKAATEFAEALRYYLQKSH
ncbi:hypothetical protein [Limnothrix sp. PR1529]|uniref:hypothetical protein n=1 Tax=Limnothrix sp. PR1529 TaxID=1704291 RepID=UPI00117B5E70|nr:hypothetical protein [Limnothrix sp. PR1529]